MLELVNANLSIEQFNHDFSSHSHELRCLHINIHSLNSKLDEFNILMNSIDVCFDVICLSEIWATNRGVDLSWLEQLKPHQYLKG